MLICCALQSGRQDVARLSVYFSIRRAAKSQYSETQEPESGSKSRSNHFAGCFIHTSGLRPWNWNLTERPYNIIVHYHETNGFALSSSSPVMASGRCWSSPLSPCPPVPPCRVLELGADTIIDALTTDQEDSTTCCLFTWCFQEDRSRWELMLCPIIGFFVVNCLHKRLRFCF